MFKTDITRKKAFAILFLLFAASILIRLPNLNRPISKHHEFNTAAMLINIESWRQAGGGSVFNYTPLINFQHPGDKLFEKGPHIDYNHNQIYLSYGCGMFIIPYAVYQFFHLPGTPVWLQIINLIFNLAAVIMLFYFFERLIPITVTNRYFTIVTACFLFMFSPGILWFFGNGYMNISIMMPFVIAALMLLLPMLQLPQTITGRKLLLLSLLIVVLIYIDWFIFFICVTAGIVGLFKIKKNKNYGVLAIVLALASATGIALVFFQFASYAGWHTVINFWKLRFHDRSMERGQLTYIKMAGLILQHLFTSYFPLLLLYTITFILLRMKKIRTIFSEQELFFIRFYTCCLLTYNLVFFNWSMAHEFSMIPFSVLAVYITARLLTNVHKKTVTYLLTLFLILSVAQYYFINRPGDVSQNGTRYDTYKNFGQHLNQVPPDYKIFINTEVNPMIEYYAGRNLTLIANYDNAKKYMAKWGIAKGVWIEQDDLHFKQILVIR